MTTLMSYDPFQEMLSLRDAMSRLFEQSFVSPTWRGGTRQNWLTPVNVYETEQGYQVYVLLPGVKPESIELTVQQNTLSFKGQFQPLIGENVQGKWLVQEFGPASFERTLTFAKPIDIDHIETKYEYGILSVFAPISEAVRPKKISITGGSGYHLNGKGEQQQLTVEAGAH